MNSFFYLLFFLYIFCIMMRITNIRKQNAKKEALEQKKIADEMNVLEEKGSDDPVRENDVKTLEESTQTQENYDTQKDSQE
ncbi:hypothetical protein CLNEO_28950 [Anaerotignum neopropionicum]|uniref:Uncharacterized protein n=1 Tax=Anaerotignum neopropionicum TaxID=36847 RepID=A0A136WBN2_9FIRM|nr:hypothetical protein [Anaerotignum neopropionicum]KXL51749.1 hypothetical protein CLNEO_28950 [Anaerotignum neopropionicum]